MLVIAQIAVFVPQRFQPRGVAETVIGAAQFHQLFGVLPINLLALALYVGAVIPAHVRAFVVQNPRVAQGVVDDFHRAVHIAGGIRILDAENKIPAVFFRV